MNSPISLGIIVRPHSNIPIFPPGIVVSTKYITINGKTGATIDWISQYRRLFALSHR